MKRLLNQTTLWTEGLIKSESLAQEFISFSTSSWKGIGRVVQEQLPGCSNRHIANYKTVTAKQKVEKQTNQGSHMIKSSTLSLILWLTAPFVYAAQPDTPTLTLNTQGLQVTLNWSAIKNATGYRLFYAPYPYQGEDDIRSIDLGDSTHFSIKLWQQATYYVAIKSYDNKNQNSNYSNISFVQIEDRGEQYHHFWKTTIEEINNKQFISDDYLYLQRPNVDSCFSGLTSNQAKDREVETLNQIRNLHSLSAVSYQVEGDIETQSASLVQKANNYLTHTPSTGDKCYSEAAFTGSNSSNLGLSGGGNEDPANDLINFIDDAFNVSTIGSVGHRRHLLNPFSQFTSYGQVYGASAVKVFDFSSSNNITSSGSPDFVAFPYLRYPYIFLSDKISDKKTPWNFSVIEDHNSIWGNQHDYFSNSNVTVTQKNNNQVLTVHSLFSDTEGIGLPNNLSWFVDDWQYDTWYTVSIENINYQTGGIHSVEYDVFIDYKNFFNISFPLEPGDIQKNTNFIEGTLKDIEDKDSFEIALDGNVTFTGSSQFSNTAFFIEVYNADKQLIKASDNAFSLNLPNSLYTLVITNCHNRSCYSDMKEYTVRIKY